MTVTEIQLAKMDLNSTTTPALPPDDDVPDYSYLSRHLGIKATFIASITLLILATIFGNTLTLVAIIRTRTLRTTANLLVVSLAVSDLMVGIGVMPLSLVKTISPDRTFPPLLCNLWVSLDVLCCTASILNLCFISLDRYRTIKCPFTYKKRQTTRHMLLQISGVWVLSTVISIAPLFGWKTQEEKIEPTCHVSQNKLYTIFSTFSAFFIPMTIMLILYWLIFLEARQRIRGSGFVKYSGHSVQASKRGVAPEEVSRDGLSHSTTSTTPSSNQKQGIQPPSPFLLPPNGRMRDSTSNPDINGVLASTKCKHGGSTTSLPVSPKPFCGATALRRIQAEKQAIAHSREQKAAKTLAIVTGVFLICWLPFFSLALLEPFFPEWQIPSWLKNLVLWLGFFNSMMNPIIYTKFNPEFQKAYRKTLRCPATRK